MLRKIISCAFVLTIMAMVNVGVPSAQQEGGETDSLVSIKMSNDKVFNVAVSNDKLEGVKVGSYITVKIVKGWAQKVSKKDAN